jgi:hypothetical protein
MPDKKGSYVECQHDWVSRSLNAFYFLWLSSSFSSYSLLSMWPRDLNLQPVDNDEAIRTCKDCLEKVTLHCIAKTTVPRKACRSVRETKNENFTTHLEQSLLMFALSCFFCRGRMVRRTTGYQRLGIQGRGYGRNSRWRCALLLDEEKRSDELARANSYLQLHKERSVFVTSHQQIWKMPAKPAKLTEGTSFLSFHWAGSNRGDVDLNCCRQRPPSTCSLIWQASPPTKQAATIT